MRKIGLVVAMLCGLGMAGTGVAEGNNSSLAPLTQADASGTTSQPDYILNKCKEYEETADPESAIHGIDPSYALANALNTQAGKKVVFDRTSIKNIMLVESAKYGKLEQRTAPNGIIYFMYYSEPGFVGDDHASFMAEFDGKRYKIVVNIKVLKYVDDNNPQCFKPQLIKVTKSSSGTNGYDLNSISVTFADLQSAAVGQNKLDSNADGFNWFIDTTPTGRRIEKWGQIYFSSST